MGNLLDSLFPEGGWLAKAQRAYTGLGGTPDEVLGPRPEAREELSVPRGELLNPLAARLAALKSGRDPVGNALLNFAGPIKAYHGSPHLFDKFSMKNVGTGEGAQAYGHGLYFAGNEAVARGYRDQLSGNGPVSTAISTVIDGIPAGSIPELTGLSQLTRAKILAALNSGTGFDDWMKYIKQTKSGDPHLAQLLPNGMTKEQAVYGPIPDILEGLRGKKVERLPPPPPNGSMYEVNLRTSPERLLDWDKPLHAQPKEVKEALFGPSGVVPEFRARRSVREYLEPHVNDDFEGLTGNQFHGVLNRLAQSDLLPANGPGVLQALEQGQTKPAAAAFLRNEGIPGIQYLDAGSRRVGEGSRNYVMFDDKLIDILKRYGLGGAAIGAGNALIPGEQ